MPRIIICIIFIFIYSLSAFAFEPKRATCIAPAKPGGGLDLTCRLLATTLYNTHFINRPMSVNFMPGGVGAVAYNHIVGVRKNDPNTVVSVSSGSVLNLAQGKFGRYSQQDVKWVAAVAADYGAIIVRKNAPWINLSELIQDIKKSPEKIIFGAGGSIGGQDWMKTALIVKAAGLDPKKIRYVAFEGGGEAITALLGKHVNVFPGDIAEISGQLQFGQLRVLAVLSDQRLPYPFENIPTAKEQGIDVSWTIWRGYYIGPEVSEDAYKWWIHTLRRLVTTKIFKKELQTLGLSPYFISGEEFKLYIDKQINTFQKLVKETGLR